jgi:hypothetical protein
VPRTSLQIPLFHGLALLRAEIAERIKLRGATPVFFDEPDLIATAVYILLKDRWQKTAINNNSLQTLDKMAVVYYD